MGQSYCTYSITMGYKGQMIGKRHLSAIFACLHSLKMLPVYCGSISFVVVSALTHCKSDTIPFSPFYCLYVVFGWFVLCQWPRIQEKSDFHLFSISLTLTASIHFIYSCWPPEWFREFLIQGRSCSRGQDAVHYETLCFLFIECHDSFLFGL